MKKMTLLFLITIIILVLGNVYQGFNINDHKKYIQKIDSQFVASLGRVSAGFEEGKKTGIFAVEQAFEASVLSQFTSYKKKNISVDSYISYLATTIRERYLHEQVVTNAKEIQQLIKELSKDPTNQAIADELILLIKKE